jgi:hypothetical protein
VLSAMTAAAGLPLTVFFEEMVQGARIDIT